jgi:hypothetical protein
MQESSAYRAASSYYSYEVLLSRNFYDRQKDTTCKQEGPN